MAELLPQMSRLLAEVRLVPATGGRFEVELDDQQIFNIATEGNLPSPRELLDRVRSRL